MIWLHATLTFSLLPQMHITTNDPTLKKKKNNKSNWFIIYGE